MTATRKWTFGAIAAALLLLVGGWFLLISPKRAEVADLQAQAASQQQTNAQDATQLEVLKQQNKDLPEEQAKLAELQTKIPTSPDLPTYIRELQSIGDRAGVTLTAMTPTTPITLGGVTDATGVLTPDALAAMNVDLTLSGPFEGIQKFMNDLESSDRYTLASGLTITDDSEQSSGTTTTATGELTATVNARIFLMPEVVPAATTAPSPTPAP